MFHAMTGCDSVAFFASRGKRTAWEAWIIHDASTEAFRTLVDLPQNVDAQMEVMERFTVLM